MRSIFDLELETQIPTNSSYIRSYPYIIKYFESRACLGVEELICGAHMIYGWMPTILDIDFWSDRINVQGACDILEKARETGSLDNEEILLLAEIINHSLVGASKFLHFVAPNCFAIWDSKVYKFLYKRKPHNYRLNDIRAYRSYLEGITVLKQDPRIESFKRSINEKLGYSVSDMRALELIMFLRSPTLS